MANYYEDARTNYFGVKDESAFLEALAGINVEIISREDSITGKKLFGLMTTGGEGWPFWGFDDDGNEYELEIFENGIVKNHLEDGHVCIVIGVGKEKMRYLAGYAIAFNNKGETEVINLSNIYEVAKGLGNKIELAEY
jgi:hypothetical protein